MKPRTQKVIDISVSVMMNSSLKLPKNPSRACCAVMYPVEPACGIFPFTAETEIVLTKKKKKYIKACNFY